MNASETCEAQWELLFRILRSTDAKVYLEEANSNPVHQQLHPNQLSNHCSGFQGQEPCRAGFLVALNAPAVTWPGDTERSLPADSSGMRVLYSGQ